jgi:hypothetical protein
VAKVANECRDRPREFLTERDRSLRQEESSHGMGPSRQIWHVANPDDAGIALCGCLGARGDGRPAYLINDKGNAGLPAQTEEKRQ